MATGLLDFRISYHFEVGGKMIGSYGQTHVQIAGRVLAEDPAYSGKSYAHTPTADAIKTILAADGITYPGATLVLDSIANLSASVAPNA